MANNGFNADTSRTEGSVPNATSQAEMFVRWKYEGSNSFRGYLSCDGVTWQDVTGATSYTLTPTHIGWSMSTWGASNVYVMSLAYIRTGNG